RDVLGRSSEVQRLTAYVPEILLSHETIRGDKWFAAAVIADEQTQTGGPDQRTCCEQCVAFSRQAEKELRMMRFLRHSRKLIHYLTPLFASLSSVAHLWCGFFYWRTNSCAERFPNLKNRRPQSSQRYGWANSHRHTKCSTNVLFLWAR